MSFERPNAGPSETGEQEARDFSSFALGDISLRSTEAPAGAGTGPSHREFRGAQRVAFPEGVLSIEMTSSRSRRGDGSLAEAVRITLGREGAEIKLQAEISYPRREGAPAKVQEEILRDDSGAELPPGTGLGLYSKYLDFVRDLAVRRGVPVLHEIRRSGERLSREQWHRMFDPVFNERGYIRLSEGYWQKMYEPAPGRGSMDDFLTAP